MAEYLIDFAFSLTGTHRGASKRKLHNWLMRRHNWMEKQLSVIDSNPDFEVAVSKSEQKNGTLTWEFGIVGRHVAVAKSGQQLASLVTKWFEKRYDYFAKYLRVETPKGNAISTRHYNPPIRD